VTVVVDGQPVTLYDRNDTVDAYRGWLRRHPEIVAAARRELAGHDLACWCGPDEACHADVLLAVAAGQEP
jgi:hypothetical protein